MSISPSPEPKNRLVIDPKHLIIYLTVSVALLILGIFLTPTVPDEIIGEVILMIIAVFTEVRRKINKKGN